MDFQANNDTAPLFVEALLVLVVALILYNVISYLQSYLSAKTERRKQARLRRQMTPIGRL
eukprot:scaffold2342_cov76-Alexandrium_tamarense.AAC.1